MNSPTQVATGMVAELIESAITELGVGPHTEARRAQLLAYIGDLESDRYDDGPGPFRTIERADGRVDVARVDSVGTQTDQPRHLIAEAVSPADGHSAAAMLNALFMVGVIPIRTPPIAAYVPRPTPPPENGPIGI